MSKHSTRTGRASSSSASRRSLRASTRCSRRRCGAQLVLLEREPRVALGQLVDPPLLAALRVAQLDRSLPALFERLPSASARASEARAHDLRRDRQRGRVVLDARTPRRPRPRCGRRGSPDRSCGGRPGCRPAPGTPGRWHASPRPRRRSRPACRRPRCATRWRSNSERTARRRLRKTAACSNSCSAAAAAMPLLELALDLRGSGRRGSR